MRRKPKVIMSRKTPLKESNDNSFDFEFWDRIGDEGRFSAAWDIILNHGKWGNKNEGQSRLQRSVGTLKQRKG